MKPGLALHPLNPTAEYWFVRLRRDDPGAQARLDFDNWIAAAAENRQAWHDLLAIWGDLEALRADAGLLHIRQEALARRRWLAAGGSIGQMIAASGILLLAGVGFFWAVPRWSDAGSEEIAAERSAPTEIANPVGKRSRIILADGSILQLDADSAVAIDFSTRLRAIDLKRGRAFFHVAKNTNRPFVVTAAGRSVTALGTRFSVDIQQRAVRVVLAEGKVRVDDRRSARKAMRSHKVELSPGHMLLAGDQRNWRPVAISAPQLLAWTNGNLLFDDQRLADVLVEVNRYSTTRIVIVDPALGDRRLSAVLNAGDIDTLLDGIARLDLAQIVRAAPDRIELRIKRGRIAGRIHDRILA